ncbi:MAG: tripartite tricarboxylate transporter TctB family protein [Rhodospirillales bacterium]|nr:tripartite tricarboxylate transporter TctB family protein [Rhodospirillales bacterium]
MSRMDKDHIGAALLIGLGLAVSYIGFGYRIGTLTRMGAGYFPVVLGILLIATGAGIGFAPRAAAPRRSQAVAEVRDGQPAWRGWLCILAGIGAFVVLGTYGGLVPATLASVFITAMGDRNNSVGSAALLAGAMTVLATVLFGWALQLQLPLFAWG